jgi:ABC-2 type transport system permease protein
MKAFFQLYLANLKEFMRDRMALFWTLAFPIFFIVLFGIIFSGGGDTSYDLGLVIEDQGPVGEGLRQIFGQVSVFEITEGERDAMLAQLKEGELSVVVIVPEGASAAVTSGQSTALEVHYDPTSQVTANIVLSIVEKVVDGFERGFTQRPTLLTLERFTVTASRLRNIDFLLPGILAMSLMQLGLFATAPAIVQLREQQVLRRIGATPLPRTTLIAAQVLHRITIGLTQTIVIIIVGSLMFQVSVIGNVALLAGFVLMGALMFVAMGYMISGLAKTQESVIGISQLVNFPMMFLSGLFFPVEVMPAWIRPVVTAMPLTYLADALRQIMVGAPPVYSLGVDFAVLVGWLIVCAVLAVRFFRWE